MIIEIFLGTGIRRQELVNLDIDDVDLDAKHLHIRRAKGGSHQVKFLKTNLRTLLRGYLIGRRKQGDGKTNALFLSNRGTRITSGQVARRVKFVFLLLVLFQGCYTSGFLKRSLLSRGGGPMISIDGRPQRWHQRSMLPLVRPGNSRADDSPIAKPDQPDYCLKALE